MRISRRRRRNSLVEATSVTSGWQALKHNRPHDSTWWITPLSPCGLCTHGNIAQYYMGPGQNATNTSPSQTDPGGKLQLAINCKQFHPFINIDKIKAVRTTRNAVMHSPHFNFAAADMKTHLQCMVDLLQESALQKYPAAQNAITEINLIENANINISDAAVLQHERSIWKQLIVDQTTNHKDILKIIASNKDLQKRLGDVYTKLKTEVDNIRRDVEDVKRDMDDVTRDVGDVRRDVRRDVGDVRRDVGDVRTDVGDVRRDVGDVRRDVGDVRRDVGDVRRDVGDVRRDVGDVRRDARRDVEDVRVTTRIRAYMISSSASLSKNHAIWFDNVCTDSCKLRTSSFVVDVDAVGSVGCATSDSVSETPVGPANSAVDITPVGPANRAVDVTPVGCTIKDN
ncbi:hypothetical protein LSAT2_011015 [Lamellibrachia satsuma]|nr:hypothetical protein LSAT2_011015 [Lamellibrachia satsuma]